MQAFYSDIFVLPLPDHHRFPMAKYSVLRERVAEHLPEVDLSIPGPATDEELLRVHCAEYVRAVETGTVEKQAARRVGFPWSPQLVERSRRSAGGTLAAARAASGDGRIAVNLAGGTHHAFADRGEGFCVFNDAAVAARAMQAEKRARRVLVVDCDVHQGNGTAAIFRSDPSVFTLSLHGARNFPFHKEDSDLDVALRDGTGDDEYLECLEQALSRVLSVFSPDLAIYLAGADPFVGDRLGKLALTKNGLRRRDELVLGVLHEDDIPVAVVMAGGYAPDVDDIVDIHFETVRVASSLARR
ncbi:MAG: histone deacetylase [Thermoanaerobaculia bacterium]|nr:histone deacetylase [Thermoanaerobaculia bacterium]